MDERGAAAAIFARVAATGITARPVQDCSSAEDTLAAVADAVQTAILPCRMTLEWNGAPGLVLAAQGGRARSASGVQGGGDVTALDAALASGDAGGAAAALVALLSGRGALSLAILPPSDGAQQGGTPATGVAGGDLMRALGLAPLWSMPHDPVAVLLDGAAPVLRAVWTPGTAPEPLRTGDILPTGLDPWIAARHAARPVGDTCPAALRLWRPEAFPGLALALVGQTALAFDADAALDIASYWATLPAMLVEAP